MGHVMRVFMHHATDDAPASVAKAPESRNDDFLARVGNVVEVICDEEKLAL